MPRNLLVKRRVVQIQDSPFPSAANKTKISWPMELPKFSPSDEEPTPSDCSSDSGRESTIPGDSQVSPSRSFERPSQLNFGLANFSGSSSSDSLSTKSPVSPYPMGHISLLPRILENLAVSPHNNYHQRLNLTVPSDVLASEQLFHKTHPPVVESMVNGQLSPLEAKTAVFPREGVNPQVNADNLLLSPASRKRSNSIGDNSANPCNNGFKVRKSKTTRKGKKEDELTSSPVSGTFIREESDINVEGDVIIIRRGDVDKSLNVVEVSDAARAELAKIDNKIGAFNCRLCKLNFQDAFGLASHNCSRIVHIEYQCPECGKSFHCPANLASHRRWHKPRSAPVTPKISPKKTSANSSAPIGPAKVDNNKEDFFVEKTSCSDMPFKKRFLLKGPDNAKITRSEGKNTLEQQSKEIKVKSEERVKHSTSPLPLLEIQHFFCHVCHSIVPGAQAFAKHWQNCLLTSEQRIQLPSFFSVKRP